jgi:hypothetical protein
MNLRPRITVFVAAALAGACALAIRTGPTLAAETDKPAMIAASPYELTATQFVADTCEVACPCLYGEAPHGGTCEFSSVFVVEKGTIGDQKLDGARFALLGSFSGSLRVKPPLEYTKWYIDPESMSEGARARIVPTLSTFFGARAPKLDYGVVTTKITVAREGGVLGTVRVTIGDKGRFEIRPLAGRDGKEPVRVENAFSPLEELAPVIIGTAEGRHEDEGHTLEFKRNSGEIHRVRMVSAPESTAVPPTKS